MIKIQIQMPEELFRELRHFARQCEWSLADTFRRGAELLLQVYAEPPPPTSCKVGWESLCAAQLRDAAFADSEPLIPDNKP